MVGAEGEGQNQESDAYPGAPHPKNRNSLLLEGFLDSLNKPPGLPALFVASKQILLEKVDTFFFSPESILAVFIFLNNHPFYETVCGLPLNFLHLFHSYSCAPFLSVDIVTYGFYSRLNWTEVHVPKQLRNVSRINCGIYQICH